MSKVCVGCGGKITTETVTAEGEDWHLECFKCDFCKQPLARCGAGSCTQKDGKRACEGCKAKLQPAPPPSKACAGCGGKITSATLTAENKDWHPECFKCDFCKQPLSQCGAASSYTHKDGKRACAGCKAKLQPAPPLLKVCAGCGGKITSATLTAENKDWHPECFRCEFCKGPLMTQGGVVSYTRKDGKRACECCKTKHQRAAVPNPVTPVAKPEIYAKAGRMSEPQNSPDKGACVVCGGHFTPGRAVLKLNFKNLHADCFKCSQCGVLLDPANPSVRTLLSSKVQQCIDGTLKCDACTPAQKPMASPRVDLAQAKRDAQKDREERQAKEDEAAREKERMEKAKAEKEAADKAAAAKAEAAKTSAEAAAQAARASALISHGAFSLEQLKDVSYWKPLGVSEKDREAYLAEDVFHELFGMDKQSFKGLAEWRRKEAKKKHELF